MSRSPHPTTAPPHIGVTGVTGFIGPHLVRHLLDAGVRVRAFGRRSWDGAPQVPREDRRLLLLPALPPRRDLEGLDALIHLAVAPHDAHPAVVHAVNTMATAALAAAALAAGVPRFVFVSSQSAHDGARNRYGRSKRAAEVALDGMAGVVVVRPGLVYDDEGGGLLGLASTLAGTARVFPVIGGDASIAQPVHVADLAEALHRAARWPDPPTLLEVAAPRPERLGDLVRAMTETRFGVRPATVGVPLSAARRVAGLGEAMKVGAGLAEVVRGIDGFRVMDTAPSLDALGMTLRPFASTDRPLDPGDTAPSGAAAPSRPRAKVRGRGGVDGLLRGTRAAPAAASGDDDEPYRLLLVGSGRIGSVHAMCALHHPDAVLCGVVEPKARNAKQVQALLGTRAPRFRSLDDALTAVRPTAAVLATPPHTHAALAERLLAAGVHVVVEKPVTPDPVARERLIGAASRSSATCIAGYQMVHLPHVRAAAAKLAAGEFGKVEEFAAWAFVARAEPGAGGLSWELDPARAGGGALPHAAAHVLSILDTLLGPVDLLDGTMVRSEGRGVEDAVWLRLSGGDASGSLFAGWHLSEFVIPENTVRVRTSSGCLVVGQGGALFVDPDGAATWGAWCFDDLETFSPAPTDGGAAYWIEQRLALTGDDGGADLALAERIERLTDLAPHKAAMIPPPIVVRRAIQPDARRAAPIGVGVDVRRLEDRAALEDAERIAGGAAALLCGVGQWEALGEPPDATIVLPDAPKAFRVITNQGPLALVPHLGVVPLARSLSRLDPTKALTAHGPIWEGIGTLVRAELARVPRGFAGRVVLDGYLVDLAAATGRLGEITELVDDLVRRCPAAAIGIETNAPGLAPAVLGVLAGRLDLVVTVASPGAGVVALVRAAVGDPGMTVLVRTGPQPPEAVAAAIADPAAWIDGGDGLMVDWRGAPGSDAAFVALLDEAMAATGAPQWARDDAVALRRP